MGEAKTRRRFLWQSLLASRLRAGRGDHGSMLWDYFAGELRAADQRRRTNLANLQSKSELEGLRTRVRRALLGMIGGLPQRSPLNAQQVGTLERSDYAIEKIVFESLPEYYVTANLYRPKSATTSRPGVIQSCGHYEEGKAAPDYQRACIGLAKKGFVVLVFDPLGQGERRMYRDPTGHPLAGGATAEHVVAGKPCYLLGRTLARYRIWDAMRALDYLESRPEVDKTRLGMFGHSGGGMVTLLTAPLEDRLRAAMSSCAVTSFYHKFLALLIADPEQILPGVYEQGIDHPELIAAFAPRAFLIGAALRDFVPLEGTRRTYEEAKHAFEVAGVPHRLGKIETNDEHKLNQELREECYAWMGKHLAGEEGNAREPQMQVETEADLRCTPNGNILDLPKARTVFDLNRRVSKILETQRIREGRASVRNSLASPVAKSEPGIILPSALSPAQERRDALLILAAEQGRDSNLAARLAQGLTDAGYPVLAVDLRGWGETRPSMPDKKVRFSWEDFFAYRSFELGRPLLGMRVSDLLVTAHRMLDEYKKIYAIGLEGGGLVAAHAAALDESLSGVAMVRTLISYQDILEHPFYAEPVASFVPGALVHYDLPQLARWISPRPCISIDPDNHARKPLDGKTRLTEPATVREILKGLGLA